MTKEQAVKEFKNEILPMVINRYGKNDVTAIRTEWNDFTDMLCKNGDKKESQYSTWDNPF